MGSFARQFGIGPTLLILAGAVIIGLLLRWWMRRTGRRFPNSHKTNSIAYWCTAVVAVAIAVVLAVAVQNAGGIVLAVLWLGLAGAFVMLARREGKRAREES
ncbi:hypothetical protein QDR37_14300 [Amnibacterium sp. CER49]|uniref:hypothetical protein n=1 Tax=Amnibacterium sp. CER49 TaxID=3039161 RepID=UPI00244C06C1|nr:hypothetical protein [Amnibacterium sp. CER49]MDH2445121.1 hypothetical protein [Amnibacterium sp. CER49]